MSYCAAADLYKKLPESMIISLSNDEAGATTVNTANVLEAIATADEEIDSYVGLVRTVPVDPAPPLLADLSAKMAIWNLHLRKYFDSTVWRETYQDCQKILLRIAEGKLVLKEDTAADTVVTDILTVKTRHQRFTRRLWRQFR